MPSLLNQDQGFPESLDKLGVTPKELAKLGFVRFDTKTGISKNGKTLCLVSDEEKFILATIRKAFKGELPDCYNLEIRMSGINPIVFNFDKKEE